MGDELRGLSIKLTGASGLGPPTSLISTIFVTMSAAASAKCAPQNPQSWMKQQKRRLKRNQVKAVLMALKPHLESENLPDEKAPVRASSSLLD